MLSNDSNLYPTRAEQKALRHQARQKGSWWGLPEEPLRQLMICLFSGACVLWAFGAGMYMWLGHYDQIHHTQILSQNAIINCILAVFAIGALFWGIALWCLYKIRSLAPQQGESLDTIEGVVTNWSAYLTASSPNETVFALRDHNGQEHLYRVMPRFEGYVRHLGRWLRVTSLPRTGRVLDITFISQSPSLSLHIHASEQSHVDEVSSYV
jgi:hypothetical protein